MFGMSFSEITLIVIIALIVFGPKQIPEIAVGFSRFIMQVRMYFINIKEELYNKSGVNEFIKIKEQMNTVYNEFIQHIQINNKIDYNEVYDSNNFENLPIYYQPELDFDRQDELFDNLLQIDKQCTKN
ncbi:MAG: twin-arginine translocase TatA/TatE family subunit [Burkholderiales bacterium]|nr:twin-arginine translocase TatA/TatE family subunit [Burkholderiales bacterium]